MCNILVVLLCKYLYPKYQIFTNIMFLVIKATGWEGIWLNTDGLAGDSDADNPTSFSVFLILIPK